MTEVEAGHKCLPNEVAIVKGIVRYIALHMSNLLFKYSIKDWKYIESKADFAPAYLLPSTFSHLVRFPLTFISSHLYYLNPFPFTVTLRAKTLS